MLDGLKAGLLRRPQLLALTLGPFAARNWCRIKASDGHYSILKDGNEIRLSHRHGAYLLDVVREFEYYFNSVWPEQRDGHPVADFSARRKHKLKSPNVDFVFTSLPEGSETNSAYLEAFNIQKGDTIIDAGAYCGLTAYLFAIAAGDQGRVIALEADPANFSTLSENVTALGAANITPVNAALWKESGSISFSSEGNMGSAVTEVGPRKSNLVKVPAVTFEDIVRDTGVKRVTHVKMDIEGAEYAILPVAKNFIAKHAPTFVIEIHKDSHGKVDREYFESFFASLDYEVRYVKQSEKEVMPLIHCIPRRGPAASSPV